MKTLESLDFHDEISDPNPEESIEARIEPDDERSETSSVIEFSYEGLGNVHIHQVTGVKAQYSGSCNSRRV